eukprot:Em0015g562a
MPTAKRNDADEFVKIIREQLLQDGTPSFSENALKDVLRESIQELPEGPLKAALCENFEEHFDKLKSLSRSRSKLTPEDFPTWSFNVLTPNGLKNFLQALKATPYTEEKCTTYKAVLASNQSISHLDAILHQWVVDAASSSIRHCLDVLRQSSLLIGASTGALGRWLKICVEAYNQMFNKVTKGTVHEEQVKEIMESLLGTILSAHFRCVQCGRNRGEDDALAALVSLYIDIALMSPNAKKVTSEQVSTLVMIVLGHSQEHCLDAVLQTLVGIKKPGTLFPLMRQLLSLCAVNPSPRLYAKYLCCFRRTIHQSHNDRSDIIAVEQLFAKIAPPSQFKQWLWDKNSSLCDDMGLLQSWSLTKTVRRLTTELSEENLERLLDVVCGAGTHTKPKESDSSLMNSEVGAQHTVSEGTEFFVDTVGEQVENIEGSKMSDAVTDLIGKLDFDVDSDKDPCKELGFVVDRDSDIMEGVLCDGTEQTKNDEESTTAPSEDDLLIVHSDKAAEEQTSTDCSVVSQVAGVGGVSACLAQTMLLPNATTPFVNNAANIEASGESSASGASVRARRSARGKFGTPQLDARPVKVRSSVRGARKKTVADESSCDTEEGWEGSGDLHPEMSSEVEEFSDAGKHEGQMLVDMENTKEECTVDSVVDTEVASKAVVPDESHNAAADDLAEQDNLANVVRAPKKRTASTPTSNRKRKKADTPAKQSITVTEQTPTLLRSSARRKRSSLAEIDDKPQDSIRSEFALPPLVEAEEESMVSSEQKDAGSVSVTDASAASSTSKAFISTEEVAEVVCSNEDMTPCLLGARRNKTAGSVDQRKTSGAKKPRSSNFASVDLEPKESETASGDPATPLVVMGRPSPIMLRSLAKFGKSKRDTSVIEVPDSLKLTKTPVMHLRKESNTLSLPARRSSRRV